MCGSRGIFDVLNSIEEQLELYSSESWSDALSKSIAENDVSMAEKE